jgi:hypothetical protein
LRTLLPTGGNTVEGTVRFITSKVGFLRPRGRTDGRPRALDYAALVALLALACIAVVGSALR